LKHLILGALMLTTGKVVSQSTTPGNVAVLTTDFLGWNNTSPVNDFPLMVRHNGNWPIQFFTDARFRMLLNPSITYGTLGSFSNIPADGFALITPNTSFLSAVKGPFSRVHLAEGTGDNAQSIGYRLWQRNGITFTGNGDQGYIGHKYKDKDYTDMIIQWSDNPGNSRPDKMRFLFTSGYNGSSTGAESEEGLEGMRLWPKDYREINVGVGDFFADGTDPTERLHVLNGRVRIEELPNTLPAVGLTKVMVVDDTTDPERGVVKWMDIANLVPADCEWIMSPGPQNNVSTAFGPAVPNCPDNADAVGIGTNLMGAVAPAKLNVATNSFNEGQRTVVTTVAANPIGGYFDVSGATNQNYGLWTNLHGACLRNTGIWTDSNGATFFGWGGAFNSHDNAQFTIGAQGTVYGGVTSGFGLLGWSRSNATTNVGVYGRVDDTTATSWAGYFLGDMHVSGIATCAGMIWGSDASIKTDVQPISGALDRIMQLQPSTYNFLVAEHPAMGLPAGQQRGLIAQQAMDILPDIVSDIHIAPVVDSAGVEVHPAATIKGINYVALVPELISAMQEQQATIARQNARIDQLVDQVNNCCTAPGSGMAPQTGGENSAPLEDMLQEQRLLIIPNPVADLTRLEYYVPQAGKVSLQVSNSDGKILATLREETAQEGAHNYNWNTTDLAAGTYFCTYMLDGAVVVKRAVKVQ